jgi:hydroxymethylpyrimidine pyrophosphatase-like HAD family hydrolase
VAIGDSAPDVAMFGVARIGVAVGGADAETLAAADYVCRGGPAAAVIELLEVVAAARART